MFTTLVALHSFLQPEPSTGITVPATTNRTFSNKSTDNELSPFCQIMSVFAFIHESVFFLWTFNSWLVVIFFLSIEYLILSSSGFHYWYWEVSYQFVTVAPLFFSLDAFKDLSFSLIFLELSMIWWGVDIFYLSCLGFTRPFWLCGLVSLPLGIFSAIIYALFSFFILPGHQLRWSHCSHCLLLFFFFPFFLFSTLHRFVFHPSGSGMLISGSLQFQNIGDEVSILLFLCFPSFRLLFATLWIANSDLAPKSELLVVSLAVWNLLKLLNI